jgi:hypothetical protein
VRAEKQEDIAEEDEEEAAQTKGWPWPWDLVRVWCGTA